MLLVLFGLLIGLSLGLTGAGGSILAVPLLIYGAGIIPVQAISISLVVVATTALIGVLGTVKSRAISLRAGLIFAVSGMAAAPFGVQLASHLDDSALLTGFALLMISVAASMWYRAQTHPENARVVRADIEVVNSSARGPACRISESGKLRITAPCAVVLLMCGLIAGTLSGLFGVGGGFIIVPMLMFVTQMDIRRAVATSLLVITLIGVSGATAAVTGDSDFNWMLATPFMLGGAAGMIAGRSLAAKLAGPPLQKGFSIAVLLTGAGMLIRTWT